MLDPTLLEDNILAIFNNPSPSSDGCAEQWAIGYRDYAEGAISCGGGSPTAGALDAAQATLKTALTAAFNFNNPPATTATSLAAAFTAFWLTPPVVFTATGAVTAVAGTAALSSGLSSLWAAGASTAEASAAAHASLLSIFTLTVVVTHPGVPCAGPIV